MQLAFALHHSNGVQIRRHRAGIRIKITRENDFTVTGSHWRFFLFQVRASLLSLLVVFPSSYLKQRTLNSSTGTNRRDQERFIIPCYCSLGSEYIGNVSISCRGLWNIGRMSCDSFQMTVYFELATKVLAFRRVWVRCMRCINLESIQTLVPV